MSKEESVPMGELADALHVHKSTIQNWTNAGLIPKGHRVGRYRVWRRDEVRGILMRVRRVRAEVKVLRPTYDVGNGVWRCPVCNVGISDTYYPARTHIRTCVNLWLGDEYAQQLREIVSKAETPSMPPTGGRSSNVMTRQELLAMAARVIDNADDPERFVRAVRARLDRVGTLEAELRKLRGDG